MYRHPSIDPALYEEIQHLKEYNVSEDVIERILVRVSSIEDYCKELEKRREKDIADLEEKARNKDAILDTLGAYLYEHKEYKW